MLIFTIDKNDTKLFMQKLLKDTAFDSFLLRSLMLETIVTYNITGDINIDYVDDEDDKNNRTFVRWGEIKPYITKLIAGNKKPTAIKIVFSLEQCVVDNLCENASAMFLNITYEHNEIRCTTGTSQKQFSLDKLSDISLEEYIVSFFKENDIPICI